MISLDVGLVSAMLGLNLNQTRSTEDINLINNGGAAEQVTGQLLRTIDPYYIDPKLYYWIREKKCSSAEVDYLIQHNNMIIPIEVKSGSTGSLKSLHLLMATKKLSLAIRINTDKPSTVNIDMKTNKGDPVKYKLLSIPHYLCGQLNRLITGAL